MTVCRVGHEVIMQTDDEILSRLRAVHDEIERFDIARDYLDNKTNDAANVDILTELLGDRSDLIRSEVADYVIIKGGISADIISRQIKCEKSGIVYPKLWVALAFEDKGALKDLIELEYIRDNSPFEKAYLDAAMFVSTKRPFFLYDLCALACSDDPPASHTAIDLLALVAADRPALLENLVSDLTRDNADNADKAKQVLLTIHE